MHGGFSFVVWRYKEDNKLAMHVPFLMNNMLYLVDEQPHYAGRPQSLTLLIDLIDLQQRRFSHENTRLFLSAIVLN